MPSSARLNSKHAAGKPQNKRNKDKTIADAPPSSSAKGPIRLDPEVLRTAAQFAELSHRSVPNQIEYWSKLGQLLECNLTTSEVHQLLAGTKCLGKVEVRDHVDLTADSIIDMVESARANGTIQDGISSTGYTYDTDSDNRLCRTDAKGEVTYGKIVANKFVENPPSQ